MRNMLSARLPAIALLSCVLGIAPSAPTGQGSFENGDIDGNGERDLSDVIRLANYLFLGGPPPVTIGPVVACEPIEPPSSFESEFYRPLDLERAAKEEHGPTAVLVSTGEHAYDWKARVGRELNGLDLERAVADQYGKGYSLVMTGVHRFDWKAVKLAEPDHYVLPVMLIASDRISDIEGVRRAVGRFQSVLGRVQGFFNARVDGVLHVLQPIVLPTSLTSAQWNELSARTEQPADRFVLLDQTIANYEAEFPAAGDNLRVALSIYTGESADVWLGAASKGRYAMAPPRATSLDCPPAGPLNVLCADAAYAIGHELGHTLGLGHTCDEFPGHPDCGKSIMQVGRPPDAVLLQREVCILLESQFFPQSN